MAILNLGIVAHVDAGKTSLTERLLHAAGVIDQIGSVDAGNTQTDTLELERRRGITIKSAVVSFALDGITVNLIDTPGHPDFIAEVERALRVLDGAVLVISAVEGVQAQTRLLLRTLRRLRIPTLLFVNKVDRRGARADDLLADIAEKLTPSIVSMATVSDLGTPSASVRRYGPDDAAHRARLAEVLAERDDALLAEYVRDEAGVPYPRLRRELAAQVARGAVHPVFFGSAVTGAGTDILLAALTGLLPTAGGDPAAPVSGRVFKVERGETGAKVAYVRMYAGTLRVRDRVALRPGQAGRSDQAARAGQAGKVAGKVTAIRVMSGGAGVRRNAVSAGEIGKVWGLGAVRIGDVLGAPRPDDEDRRLFPPPTLATVVEPSSPADAPTLYRALRQLAEQDPLIDVRRDGVRHELSVSLYGEVQKEVIQDTLAAEYGLDVTFRETTTIYLERPAGTGSALEVMGKDGNPYQATVGLRLEPGPAGSGIQLRLDVPVESMPLFIYRQVEEFRAALAEIVRRTLAQGLHGWQVTDCALTLTDCGYLSPATTTADFRKLTPLVVMTALRRAGTVVCEPIHRFRLDCPPETVGPVLGLVARLGGTGQARVAAGASSTLTGYLPAARVRDLEQRLPGLTHGEGVVECEFDRYQPVRGSAPSQQRWDDNPLDREEYLLRVERRILGGRGGGPA